MKINWHHLSTFIFVLALFISGNLAYEEFLTNKACPSIGVVPACYIVLLCVIVPFVSHLVDRWRWIYYAFAGFAFLLAVFASTMQIVHVVECPKTIFNVPLCYVSFLLFGGIVFTKWRSKKG